MANPIIYLRWKQSATAADMSEIIRSCKAKGWRIAASRGLWMIFTRPLPLPDAEESGE